MERLILQKSPGKIFANAGIFDVALLVTSAQGCVSDSFKMPITVFAQPTVNILQSLLYVPEGMIVQLLGLVNDTTFHLQWSPAIDFITSDTIVNPTIQPHNDRFYTLTATGDGGCTAYDSIYIKVQKAVNIPNVFSPNGDGINDYWNIINLGNYPNARVEIYDRYGHLVYKTTGTAKIWDGKFNGKPLPVGVYYYIIEPNANGYGKLNGSITLLR
jgi:gliding motility-associated-like protein